MGPEYIKTAQSLHPLVPAYAVDCDTEANKPLCAEPGHDAISMYNLPLI